MKSLSIKNYKNLRNLKIDSLSKVNLIVGTNNSGKSTLLEAISIFAANGDAVQLRKILSLRGLAPRFSQMEEDYVEKEKANFLTLYSNMDINAFFTNPIEFSAFIEGETNTVSIKMINIVDEWVTDSTGESSRRRRVMNESDDDSINANITQGLMIGIGNDNGYLYPFANTMNRSNFLAQIFPFEYVLTTHISSVDNPRYFDAIALSDLEKELINALKIIDENIDAINFLSDSQSITTKDENRVPMVVYPYSTQRYRLSTMGDGINRILNIILAMLNCKDGVFLVDEFDNGLHHSVQTKLWKMIYRLAEKLNIQVFATTHSDDCIKSFIGADENGDGKLIRLEDRGGDITAVEFDDKERLMFAINNDVEVR